MRSARYERVGRQMMRAGPAMIASALEYMDACGVACKLHLHGSIPTPQHQLYPVITAADGAVHAVGVQSCLHMMLAHGE
jgi:hypothetical protein